MVCGEPTQERLSVLSEPSTCFSSPWLQSKFCIDRCRQELNSISPRLLWSFSCKTRDTTPCCALSSKKKFNRLFFGGETTASYNSPPCEQPQTLRMRTPSVTVVPYQAQQGTDILKLDMTPAYIWHQQSFVSPNGTTFFPTCGQMQTPRARGRSPCLDDSKHTR